ncbi:MAG: transposase [Chloroflexota bacterium]
MKRSAILSLKFATAAKQETIATLLTEYRRAVNFYLDVCWDKGGRFDENTLRQLTSPLSYRYKGQALKQAIGIVVGTQRSAKERGRPASKPFFSGGADLSTNFLNLSPGENTFDCWAKLSTLDKGHPLWLPVRKTRVFSKWADQGALVAGGTLFERRRQFYLRVTFDIRTPEKSIEGLALGIDRGVNVVLATSDGNLIGTDLDRHIERIKRTLPKSRGRERARKARDQYVNECLKALPFAGFAIFVIEQLKGIKFGKRGKLSRRTNRRFSHWTVGALGQRLKMLCEENRVRLVEVPPAYTSQYCPSCGHVEKGNRRGAVFRCLACGHSQHADLVGARNILGLFLGTISVPHAKT